MGSLISVCGGEPTGKKTSEALFPAVLLKLQTTGRVTQGDHHGHQLTVQNLGSMGGFEGDAWRAFLVSWPGCILLAQLDHVLHSREWKQTQYHRGFCSCGRVVGVAHCSLRG